MLHQVAHKAHGAAGQLHALQGAAGIDAAQGVDAGGAVVAGVHHGHALPGLLQIPGEGGPGGFGGGEPLQGLEHAGPGLPKGVHGHARLPVGEQGGGPGDAPDDALDEEALSGQPAQQDIIIGRDHRPFLL